MSTFQTYATLGFRHIADLGALDHILFLVALAAIYRLRDWRDALWVVTAFTVGHSVTLALAVTRVLELPTTLIEFLIPITIVVTGIENMIVRDRRRAPWRGRYRPVFAGAFGLVHGAGFANYLRSMFVDQIALPLLGFNVGIELGQIAVLTVVSITLVGLDRAIERVGRTGLVWSPHRLRVVAVSSLVTVVAFGWAIERKPW